MKLPRPVLRKLPNVYITKFPNGYWVEPATGFELLEHYKLKHLKELHAAPFWEGDAPKWAQ